MTDWDYPARRSNSKAYKAEVATSGHCAQSFLSASLSISWTPWQPGRNRSG